MNIEELVPPLELCMKIPEGKFSHSALVWNWNGEDWDVRPRKWADGVDGTEVFPAPTLAEIIEELGYIEIWKAIGGYEAFSVGELACGTPSEAALQLWLELNAKGKKNG